VDTGLVWECDPTGTKPAVARPALGAFKHEAVCVDPGGQRLYLTEDIGDGGLYRFTPTAYPDLSAGRLEIATDGGGGKIVWKEVPDPSGAAGATRGQVADHLVFQRGEGIWFDSGTVYVATTTDETIHAYDTKTERIDVLYRADDAPGTPLRGVDNLHVSRSGDLFVAEDSYTSDPDAMDVCLITPDRVVSRFLKLTGPQHDLPGAAQSETVGLCFDPSGTRFYVGSQRGFGFGIVYEISGPFRRTATPTPAPVPGVPLGLEAARRMTLSRFVRRGLPVSFTLDAGAIVTVTVKSGGKRLARVRKVVDAGPETLLLRPGRRKRPALRARTAGLRARIIVRIEEPGQTAQTFRFKLRLRSARRG
jgi:secreted PhoX family phosphatase